MSLEEVEGVNNANGNDSIENNENIHSSLAESFIVDDAQTTNTIEPAVQPAKKSNSNLVNKRIDFDPKTLKRIEMMVPAFRDEVGQLASNNDVMSFIIAKGIDALFDGEFKKKIEEM